MTWFILLLLPGAGFILFLAVRLTYYQRQLDKMGGRKRGRYVSPDSGGPMDTFPVSAPGDTFSSLPAGGHHGNFIEGGGHSAGSGAGGDFGGGGDGGGGHGGH